FANEPNSIPSPLGIFLCMSYLIFLIFHIIDKAYQIFARQEFHKFRGKRRIFFCSLLNREVLVWFFCSLAFKSLKEPGSSSMGEITGDQAALTLNALILIISPIVGGLSTFFNLTPFNLNGLFNSRLSIVNILNFSSKLISV